jgi:hypothetical protein
MSRFPAIVPPPGFLAFSHQNDRKLPKKQRMLPPFLRRQTIGSPIAAGNDMSITDNVLQTQQEQREVACLIVPNPADIIVGDRLRVLDRKCVEQLKESGLKTPISVRSSAQGWTLVAGRGSVPHRSGKIAEWWVTWDNMTILRALGHLPSG